MKTTNKKYIFAAVVCGIDSKLRLESEKFGRDRIRSRCCSGFELTSGRLGNNRTYSANGFNKLIGSTFLTLKPIASELIRSQTGIRIYVCNRFFQNSKQYEIIIRNFELFFCITSGLKLLGRENRFSIVRKLFLEF